MKSRKNFLSNFLTIVLLIVIGCGTTDSSGDNNNQNPPNETGQVTDVEGNVYKTIKIGNQWWMAENLRTTKYNNGDQIPNVTDNSAWTALNTPAYCWYENNNATYGTTYGALYNWFTIDAASNGNRSICPTGWHIPTNAEFLTMINNLGGILEAGGKMKEDGTSHWTSPNAGASNTSGFTGLPGGFRGYVDGSFQYLGNFGHWWSCSSSNANEAWNIGLFYLDSSVNNSTSVKKLGFSIRCVKN
jgi:uncharacterized protein (TIGR02145 family)